MGNVHIKFSDNLNWQAMPDNPAMLKGQVHVYRIRITSNLYLLEHFSPLLTPAERERGSKYLQLKDRRRFVISRGAQRTILGRYVNMPGGKLEFALGENKKPRLVNDAGIGIHYNLTHSGDYILLAVSPSPVGADVEMIDQKFPYRDVLRDNFGATEIGFIMEKQSLERFFLLWTRKEALLKATGQGLGEHLSATPSLDGDHIMPIDLSCCADEWQISSFDLPDGYLGSIATAINSKLQFFDFLF